MTELDRRMHILRNVEDTMRLRDYFIIKYPRTDAQRNSMLSSQFPVAGSDGFYEAVDRKMMLDGQTVTDDKEDWSIKCMFDLHDLDRNDKTTYVHFNWSDNLSSEMLKRLVNKLEATTKCQTLLVVTKATNTPTLPKSKFTIVLFPFHKIFSTSKLFSPTFFPISTSSNNLFLINKMLVARNTLFELIETRKYTENPGYTYYDGLTGNFSHFSMDLETRFKNSCNDSLPLNQRNYFDVFGIKNTAGKPVYFHFLTKNDDDIAKYVARLAASIRDELSEELRDETINLVLITAKKITAKSPFKEMGDIDRENNLSIDVIQLDTLLYNPLKNVYQPKFTLIKRRNPQTGDTNSKHTAILQHCGGHDAVPKMLLRDPVNKFFGGEPGDIYEIKRTQHIRINDDKNSQLHLDISYRMVAKR